jgi:hypothetical protein
MNESRATVSARESSPDEELLARERQEKRANVFPA